MRKKHAAVRSSSLAGGAAHLLRMVVQLTLPVIGVPVKSRALSGVGFALLHRSMPGGVPVATMAIGEGCDYAAPLPSVSQ